MKKHQIIAAEPHGHRLMVFIIFALLFVLIIVGWRLYLNYHNTTEAPTNWQFISCDVGQGDMSLIKTDDHSAIAIDAGPDPQSAQSCLTWAGITTITHVFITHDHLDHRGGLEAICHQCTVITSDYSSSKISTRLSTAQFVQAQEGMTYQLSDNTTITVISAPQHTQSVPGDSESSQENNSSLVLNATFIAPANFSVLLTGDIEEGRINQLLPQLNLPRTDILKIPHHGSKYSGTALETRLKPAVGVIYAGKNNSYGHPNQEIIDALQQTNTHIFETETTGHIAFVAAPEGNQLEITTQKT